MGKIWNVLPWGGRVLIFLAFYIREVVMSNLRVAYDVLTPTHHMKPAFVALPLPSMSERQILILSNLITMTPGTLSLDVSADRSTLYLHAMYGEDAEEVRGQLSVYVKKVKEVV